METRLDEIAPQIFRIAVWTGKVPITFKQFVIRDGHPALIHTGMVRRQGIDHETGAV